MPLRLIIARHGNTFESGEAPRRVGARTDMPLTSRGRDQAHTLGRDLSIKFGQINKIYAAPLLRTQQTAEIAASEMAHPPLIETLDFLREVDHGPDENKSDDIIAARLGPQALPRWDKDLIMPDDWSPRPSDILKSWQLFLDHLIQDYEGACRSLSPASTLTSQTVLVVTSNGIARFAPLAVLKPSRIQDSHTGNYRNNEDMGGANSLAPLLAQLSVPSLRLATGAYGEMSYDDTKWVLIDWNRS